MNGPSKVRYGMAAFALSLAMIAYIQRAAIGQAAPDISADLNLTKEQMALVFSAFALAYAFLEIPMGALGDRLGVRRTLTQIIVLWSVFTALTGAAFNFASLWGARLLFGAGEAGCFPLLTKLLSNWLPRGERMKAQALMWASTRAGGAVAPLLVLGLIGLVGWRWAFVVFGAASLIWLVVFRAFYKDDPASHKGVNAGELELLADSRALATDTSLKWTTLLIKPEVLVLVVQYFCFAMVWTFYLTWLPTYLIEQWGMTKAQAAGYATWPMLAGAAGSIISGFLPVRVPRKWLAFGAFLATAVLLYVVTQAQSVALAMAAMAVASFCSDLTMPISWNTTVEIGKRYTGTVAGAMNMFGNFAGILAPFVSAKLVKDAGGDWNNAIYLMVALSVACALAWLYLDPDKIARRNMASGDPA